MTDVATVSARAGTRVVRVGPEHASALADFFRDVGWSSDATAASVRDGRAAEARDNPGAFGEEPPTFAVVADDRVLGYVSSIPTRVWCGGRELPAHWVKGLMVRPEHRNGPIGYLVLKEAARHLRRAIATVVHPAARRLFGALGFRDLGTLSNHVKVLRPGRVLDRLDIEALGLGGSDAFVPRGLRVARRLRVTHLAGGAAQLAQAVWSASAGRSGVGADRVEPSDAPAAPEEMDALWERARNEAAGGCVRDARHLAWRYAREHGRYRFVTVRSGAGLDGLAVLRRPRLAGDGRLRGIRVATLSDLLYPADRPSAALALLAGAERDARALGADALLCSTSTPALRELLVRRAFLSVPGNLHFLMRDVETPPSLPDRIEQWWLTRGDGESDGTF